jgi:deoxyribodipyrimidine photo-lyase
MGGERGRTLKAQTTNNQGPVLYWMQRSQRIHDNWSLLYTQEYALKHNKPLIIVFNLFHSFLDATIRQFDFMLKGISETAEHAKDLNIPFYILHGDPVSNLSSLINQNQISALFTDFCPIRIINEAKQDLISKIEIPVFEVDSQNIVPAWIASPKLEFGAYTLRPKIKKLLPQFLTDIPAPKAQTAPSPKLDFGTLTLLDPKTAINHVKADMSVLPVTWLKPGYSAAQQLLAEFIQTKLPVYSTDRNDPNLDGISHISPYLHFGQFSAQRVAYEIKSNSGPNTDSTDAYLEELIVRRELADNYCYYNPNYDNFNGFHAWAQKTLNEHRFDKREFTYSQEDLEQAKTHDPLWNAAQMQMVETGKMHGFMRMYWAKKILEWTPTPEDAQSIAINLNDKYELDGLDPNGYTGIAWSIGGVHDRAWGERPVFGKIRFMNYAGCKRKFDIKAYESKWNQNPTDETLF